MKNLLTQCIVILALLCCGLFLVQNFSQTSRTAFQELGELRSENEMLVKENEELGRENQDLTQENQRLSVANHYLMRDFRTARIEVLEQTEDPEVPGKILETKIRFTEFDPVTGAIAAKPAEFVVAGDMVYVDALVVKFEQIFIETADLLRNRSLVSFQRIFGEDQAPSQGFRVDQEGRIPPVYRSSDKEEDVLAFEKEIWENFWEISNDRVRQKELGIQAIHGEAPSQKLQPGRIYHLDLRASDGLSFRVE
ncbi:MAG: hypothetical protein J6A23_14580 [Thermoguttaceae bacterium]|nr:hypothetical protein [Thermoguttaceae bacterium]MBP3693841.1 hypothetical protein [Thermoguttaceae bacterium]